MNKDTVVRLALVAGQQAQEIHDERVAHLALAKCSSMRKWSFVAKKEKHCRPDDPLANEEGDNWDHIGLDRNIGWS